MTLSQTLEAAYFKWRKARYDGLAAGRKRDKGWWNDLDFQKKWQEWLNNESYHINIVPTPSRSILEKLYNRLAQETASLNGSAKRGMPPIQKADWSLLPAAAGSVRLEADEPASKKSLIDAFNGNTPSSSSIT